MHDDVERVLADQRQRWLAGDKVSVEALLAGEPRLLADEEAVVELILGEVRLRTEVGEPSTIEAILSRFPAVAGRLRPTLRLMAFLSGNSLKTTSVLDRRRGSDTPQLHPAPEAAPAAAFPVVPNYVIEGRLGSGGRGVVYKAWQPDAERTVALKMIKDDEADNPEALKWFEREWKAVARLSHPNIVQMYELGKCDGRPYFTMEYVDGGTLTKLLGGKPMPAAEAAALVEVLARAVQHAHERGVVHRDLKPGNVLVSSEGRVKLVDFGLAKRLGGDPSLIDDGSIVGTVAYMAPEQAAGKNTTVGPRTDVWGLGTILYQCLTGRPPFQDDDLVQLLVKIQSDEPAALPREVPADLATVCRRCLEKEQQTRYPDAAALAEELRRVQAGEPIESPRRRPLDWLIKGIRNPLVSSGLAGCLVLAAVAVPLALSPKPPDRSDDPVAEDTQEWNEAADGFPHPPREREAVEKLLAQGKRFEFGGPKELPGPFRWVLGNAGPPEGSPPARAITVQALEYALLEVVADPGCDAYRFRAEVRQEAAATVSGVGLYVGHREVRDPEGRKQGCFIPLIWSRELRGREMTESVEWACWAYSGEPGQSPRFSRSLIKELGTVPPGQVQPQAGWQRLEYVVRDSTVRAGSTPAAGGLNPVAELPAARLDAFLGNLKRGDRHLGAMPAAFRPRSGLGIVLVGGKFALRGITVEPLPAKKGDR